MDRKNMKKILVGTAVLSLLTLTSCNGTNFTMSSDDILNGTDAVYKKTFPVTDSVVQFTQPNSQVNDTTVAFLIEDSSGLLVQDLTTSDLKITENNVNIKNFVINKNSTTYRKVVDIQFVVDVTVSMKSTIEAAKKRLVDFVNNSRELGYHTRMCVSTFGDQVFQKCARFYDNDPSRPETEVEVAELISEISKIQVYNDPNDKTLDENSMKAIIDGADAPWGADSQRFMILVTDAKYLYSPGNQGAVGALAPTFAEVTAGLNKGKMKVFAVTPSAAGYNSNFKDGTPSVVTQSGGEWFKYADLVSGKITLNTVLNSIMSLVNTTFYVSYTIDSQTPSLDPSLPLSKRNIKVTLVNPIGTIKDTVITSNLPDGRVPDQKVWKVSTKELNPAKVKVYVDGVLQSSGYKISNGNSIEFTSAKVAHSVIKVVYQYKSLADSVKMSPVIIALTPEQVSKLKIYVNGQLADPKYYEIYEFSQGSSSILFTDELFSVDPYGIAAAAQMSVSVRY